MNDDHDLGLPYDLRHLLTRRNALTLLASAAALGTAGCDRLPLLSRTEAEVSSTSPDGKECVVHPRETEGPFPADGSNRAHGTLANVLSDSGIVRKDMRKGLNDTEATAEGVELRLTATLVAVGTSCTPLENHAVYLWHCDADGQYSIYNIPDTTYLRAVGVSDAQGKVEFVTIVPGCYEGRYPHMHFEVYPSLPKATDYRNRILTSQLAIPADACNDAYRRHPAYRRSIARLERSPLDRDMIFRDNTPKQLAAQTLAMRREGDGGYSATVTIGLNAASS